MTQRLVLVWGWLLLAQVAQGQVQEASRWPVSFSLYAGDEADLVPPADSTERHLPPIDLAWEVVELGLLEPLAIGTIYLLPDPHELHFLPLLEGLADAILAEEATLLLFHPDHDTRQTVLRHLHELGVGVGQVQLVPDPPTLHPAASGKIQVERR